VGTREDELSPVRVKKVKNIVAVAGDDHTLAVKENGRVLSWGANSGGKLGDGTTTGRMEPVKIDGLYDVVAVGAGNFFSTALLSDGTVSAWGANDYGELGDGTRDDHRTPMPVPGFDGVAAMDSGAGHTLAIRTDGRLWAWGFNETGQLGLGTFEQDALSPTQVVGLVDVVSAGAGSNHSVAALADGTAWGFGWNQYGQLGDGQEPPRDDEAFPVQVVAPEGPLLVSAGSVHSMGVAAG